MWRVGSHGGLPDLDADGMLHQVYLGLSFVTLANCSAQRFLKTEPTLSKSEPEVLQHVWLCLQNKLMFVYCHGVCTTLLAFQLGVPKNPVGAVLDKGLCGDPLSSCQLYVISANDRAADNLIAILHCR